MTTTAMAAHQVAQRVNSQPSTYFVQPPAYTLSLTDAQIDTLMEALVRMANSQGDADAKAVYLNIAMQKAQQRIKKISSHV